MINTQRSVIIKIIKLRLAFGSYTYNYNNPYLITKLETSTTQLVFSYVAFSS